MKLSLFLVTSSLLGACAGGDLVLPSQGDLRIEVVDGDSQSGPVGGTLSSPVIVQVTGADSQPVKGAAVQFALTSAAAGAEVAPPTAITDREGRAEAHVLLGGEAGLLTGEARLVVDGAVLARASFSALAMSDTPANQPPTAAFASHCQDLTCRFDDASTDADGSVTGWAWKFGDGDTSTERQPSHTYGAAGTYAVTLRVTDDGGSTNESSRQVTVTAPATPPSPPPPPASGNKPPKADFDARCKKRKCDFTDKSKDDDGRIVAWRWNFGDGASSQQRNKSHTYDESGKYSVTLTVTDDRGATDTKLREVDVKR